MAFQCNALSGSVSFDLKPVLISGRFWNKAGLRSQRPVGELAQHSALCASGTASTRD